MHETSVNHDLFDSLASMDHDTFWKVWRNQTKEGDSLVTRVEGETTEIGIADVFCNHFQKVYSGSDSPRHLSLRDEFLLKFNVYQNEHIHDSISPYFASWSDMVNVVGKIKSGKASSGPIRPEHLFHGSPKLLFHLHLLFNAMIQHGIVVDDFVKGTITPIVKDSQGDVSSCSNYRGITLCGLFSKLFEMILDEKLAPFLESDCLQFGFKKKTSTSHAIYTLKTAVDYFNKRGSDVFVAFLDCSKAFDRISHYGLFIKLMERQIPLCLLYLIIFWHLNMSCKVKWGDAFSKEFPVPLGTKQGGISSPKFFSLYIDGLIDVLRRSGLGCHLIHKFVGAILFADDLALFAPSRSALQKMITICRKFCETLCLDFNSSKSKVLIFGKSCNDTVVPLTLKSCALDFVCEWKYLGVTIVSGKTLSFSARSDLSSFFRASNAITSTLRGAHEHTLLTLIYSNCVPIISYACAVKQYSAREMSECNTAINNALRKVFGFTEWQSIRTLREAFGFPSIYETFKKAETSFLNSCRYHSNPVIRFLISVD